MMSSCGIRMLSAVGNAGGEKLCCIEGNDCLI